VAIRQRLRGQFRQKSALYHDTNRDPQAIEIYKQLADHPTLSAGKTTAQFLLASL
jgi:hypothetical protein